MEVLPRLCTAIAILLFLSAFFSAAEMALTSTNKIHLQMLADKYLFLKNSVEWVIADRYKAISAILIGNNLVNIAASTTATALAIVLWHAQGTIYAVAIMTVLIIIFGEVLPKCIAMAKGEDLLIVALPLIRLFSFVVNPFIWTMNQLAYYTGRLTGLDLSLRDSFTTKEEIGQVVKIGEAAGVLEESEREMIDGVISFDETRVYEIMVPRTRMDILESDRTVAEALLYIQKKGHSRVPVYEGTVDNIKGIVLIKDLLLASSQGKNGAPITSVMRKPLFVPETMYVPRLFKLMQTVRMHMAVVVDEYGGTAGLVTLEDLLEEIVGEIHDEYDREEAPVTRLPDGSYKLLASISLYDLNETIGSDFECEEADSLGGFLLDRFGNFPHQGDSILIDDWNFQISSMGEHRIIDVIAKKNHEEPEDDSYAE